MSRQAMPVSEKSGGVQSYSTVQARKIDRRREPTILRITSYAIACETRCIGDRIPLLTLTGRIPKKKRMIPIAEFPQDKVLGRILGRVKIPQAPFSWCGRTKFDSPALGLTPCGTQEALSLTGLFEYRDSAQESSTDWEIAIADSGRFKTVSVRLRFSRFAEPLGRNPGRIFLRPRKYSTWSFEPVSGTKNGKLIHSLPFSFSSGTPNCTRDSQEEQWATAIELIRQTSKWFVEARDTKACWNLLAKLFDFPFFELLKLTAPYTLQGRPSREASVAKNRLIQDLPEEAQQELRKFEETLKVHSELVDSHKAAARLAAKQAKLERERQALNIKRRRTDAEAVQLNTETDRQEIPQAHAGVSGFTRQIPADPLVTARRDLINRAYVKDLQPPKVRQGLVSAGTNPSKGKQLAAPVGISPLLKQVSAELSAITGLDVVPVEDFPATPDVQRRRTRSTGRVVPPAQSVIDSFWVPERGTIRPQVPQGSFDLTRPPFTIDGKTLHPVVERIDHASTSQSPTVLQIGHSSLVPTQEAILEEHQATPSEQAAPSRAKAKGKAVRPVPTAELPTEPGSDSDSQEVIICEILNHMTPKKVKVKKEKKPKKSAKIRKDKAPRTPLALRKPPLGDLHDDLQLDTLFGSMSEDEDNLLSSPKTGPGNLPTQEPIEIDQVELEIHTTRAELLCEDADRIIFNK
ncbi:hypothetical protein DAPPUDRAFT_112455 [Daphnia pulex]|uniref:Uncharacterized protein n=1 Tax=Daphnia pulex TaxID=6669 RepID=E9HC44_DAPPU|nr:hypothetical protein DAPPUDRAFT_112455 [Daphnia pulex]|eukprot:EFX70724.1 hypothetical protein DAPPUDRAFT_112455 [Daphnia pulex]